MNQHPTEQNSSAPAVVRSAPARIWLQVSDDAEHQHRDFPRSPHGDEVTWSPTQALACEVEYVRADLAAPAPEQPTAAVPAGFALVPLRMNAEMRRIVGEGDWQWEDLLAAAEAITEEQYDELQHAPAGCYTASQQRGAPGACMLAQVWGPDGQSVAVLDATADPAAASSIAQRIATMLSAPAAQAASPGLTDAPDDDQIETWKHLGDQLLRMDARTLHYPTIRAAAMQLHNAALAGTRIRAALAAPTVAPDGDRIPMPQNARQAQGMVNLGLMWLKDRAPELLRAPTVAQAGVADAEALAAIFDPCREYDGLQVRDMIAKARKRLPANDIAAKRLAWLHSPASNDVNGYEWGVFRVKWLDGKAAEVQQTYSDFSDLDAAMAGQATAPSGQDAAPADVREAFMRWAGQNGALGQFEDVSWRAYQQGQRDAESRFLGPSAREQGWTGERLQQRLSGGTLPAPRPAAIIATGICLAVAELPDRTSPADWPEAMLVTAPELMEIVIEAIRTSDAAAGGEG